MSVREELLFDFAINMPRVLVSGETTVLDNVRKVMLLTDSEIVVFSGAKYTSLKGRGFVITQLKEGRMLVSGEMCIRDRYCREAVLYSGRREANASGKLNGRNTLWTCCRLSA